MASGNWLGCCMFLFVRCSERKMFCGRKLNAQTLIVLIAVQIFTMISLYFETYAFYSTKGFSHWAGAKLGPTSTASSTRACSTASCASRASRASRASAGLLGSTCGVCGFYGFVWKVGKLAESISRTPFFIHWKNMIMLSNKTKQQNMVKQ